MSQLCTYFIASWKRCQYQMFYVNKFYFLLVLPIKSILIQGNYIFLPSYIVLLKTLSLGAILTVYLWSSLAIIPT